MPLDNLAEKHFTESERTTINYYLQLVMDILKPKAANLNPDDRNSFGSVGETNKLIVNKVKDYYESHSNMASPDVDWAEFMADYEDRHFLQNALITLNTITQLADNTRIAHDYDNYQASLNDYDYSLFKLRKNPEYETKVNELKQFFNRTGTKNNEDETPPAK